MKHVWFIAAWVLHEHTVTAMLFAVLFEFQLMMNHEDECELLLETLNPIFQIFLKRVWLLCPVFLHELSCSIAMLPVPARHITNQSTPFH